MKYFILLHRYSYLIHVVGFILLLAINFLCGIDAAYKTELVENKMEKLSELSFYELGNERVKHEIDS